MDYTKILDVTQFSKLRSVTKSAVDDSLFLNEPQNNSLLLGSATNRITSSPIIHNPVLQSNIIDQLKNFNKNYTRSFYAHSKHFHCLFVDTVFACPIMAKYRVLKHLVKERMDREGSNSKSFGGIKSTGNMKFLVMVIPIFQEQALFYLSIGVRILLKKSNLKKMILTLLK